MARSELPKDWRWKKIGDVVEIHYGKGLPKRQRLTEGAVPVYGSNGKVGYHDSAITNGPTIIIGRKGSIGEVHFSSQPCWPIDTTYFLNEFPEFLSVDYFYYFLKSLDLSELNRAAAIPGIRRDDIYSVEILVPPLEEQKRIVARIEELLSRIDQAKSLRQKSLGETSAVVSSVRHQIFSSADEMGWDVKRLGSVLKLTSGNFLASKRMEPEGPYAVYGGNDIVGYHTEYLFEEPKVIIGRVGAKCGCVYITRPRSWITDNALYVKGKSDDISNEYLALVLTHLDLRQYANQAAQPVISQKLIYPLEIPIPPLGEQVRMVSYFDQLQQRANELQRLQCETEKEMEQITQSILTTAFRGEL